jgi:hypothetical protein
MPKFEQICEYQSRMNKTNSKSIWTIYLLNQCRNLFDTYFGNHWPAFHAQESVATNDCFTSFKYSYEFVTNYDFDEFIFPRKFTPTHDLTYTVNAQLNCINNSITLPFLSSYDLYNYTLELMRTRANETVGSLHFEHMLFFDTIPENVSQNLANNDVRKIQFEYKKDLRFYLSLNSVEDFSLANYFVNTKSLVECLNKTIRASGKVKNDEKIWNRVYTVWMDRRKGKSIYNTNYTEFINQHFADLTSGNGVIFNVPVDRGYASHFRDDLNYQFFHSQTYKLSKHFRIDLEFYYFLAAFSKITF